MQYGTPAKPREKSPGIGFGEVPLVRCFQIDVAEMRKGRAAFEAEAKEFLQMFSTLLQSRKNPFYKYTNELFTIADWERVVDATLQAIAREDELYTLVQKTAPDGIDPASYQMEAAAAR